MKLQLISQNRNFRLIWFSQVISQVGTRMFQLSTIWWLASLAEANTGLWVGVYMAGCSLPALIFARQVGGLIDRKGSRSVLLRADFFGAIFSLALVIFLSVYLSPDVSLNMSAVLPVLLGIGWLLAACQSFIEPSLNKAVPDLVSKESLEPALAFMSSTSTMAAFAGAIIGAFTIEKLGLAGVVALNGITFVVSFLCDRAIRFTDKKIDVATPASPSKNNQEELTGWQILNKNPMVKKTLYGFAFCNFFGVPTLMVIPLYVKNVLHGSVWQLGLIESAVWLGLLMGTFASAHLPGKNKPYIFGTFAMIGLGAGLALPAFFQSSWFYGLSLFSACFVLGAMNVRFMRFFHSQVPAEQKGRFFAVFSAIIGSMTPLGFTLFSFLSGAVSVPVICMIQGAGVITASIYFLYLHVLHNQTEGGEVAFS